jgi:hypothetical protein
MNLTNSLKSQLKQSVNVRGIFIDNLRSQSYLQLECELYYKLSANIDTLLFERIETHIYHELKLIN